MLQRDSGFMTPKELSEMIGAFLRRDFELFSEVAFPDFVMMPTNDKSLWIIKLYLSSIFEDPERSGRIGWTSEASKAALVRLAKALDRAETFDFIVDAISNGVSTMQASD